MSACSRSPTSIARARSASSSQATPILDDRLAEPSHQTHDWRITTVACLALLSVDETRDYVRCASTSPAKLDRGASSAMIVAPSRKKNLVAAQDVHDARIDRGGA